MDNDTDGRGDYACRMGFIQEPPRLGNQYDDDLALRALLSRRLPADVQHAIEPELRALGAEVATWWPAQVAQYAFGPRHVPFDAWGNRIDAIELSDFWRRAPALAARWGLVAAGYEPRFGEYARVHQFALAYLFTASSEIYSCPLAMTDGAARCLLASGNQALIERAVPRLTSRDPDKFWTSGQWMTETAGGSDVSNTETIARPDGRGGWTLHGRKWFTSAIISEMALTLARPDGAGPGGDALAMFYVEPRGEDGRFRGLVIDRLKPKLGTRKLPTAEITLDGLPAILVGEPRHGVRQIAPMLNVTRLWNSIAAVSLLRRGYALALDYARRRRAFGRPLIEHPLHARTLATIAAELEAGLELAFAVAALLGRVEHHPEDREAAALLRILTPVAKLATGRMAVAGLAEVVEAFGGAGYIEDTGIPTLLRDAQVLSIWEGTTNVLSLDTLRAIGQAGGLGVWRGALERELAALAPGLAAEGEAVRRVADRAEDWFARVGRDRASLESGARGFALTLARAYAQALLLRRAAHDGDTRSVAVARHFAALGMDRLCNDDPAIPRAVLVLP
jgi:alkylation response protein AidB-like acyl-CoA dehydrogenase